MTTTVLEKLDRAARELHHSIIARVETPMYDLKDVEMRDLLQDAAKRIRILEAEINATKFRRRGDGLGGLPARWR